MVSGMPREESVSRKRQQSTILNGAERLSKRTEYWIDNIAVGGDFGHSSIKMVGMDVFCSTQRTEFEGSE